MLYYDRSSHCVVVLEIFWAREKRLIFARQYEPDSEGPRVTLLREPLGATELGDMFDKANL